MRRDLPAGLPGMLVTFDLGMIMSTSVLEVSPLRAGKWRSVWMA